MICKWCGAAVDVTKGKCPACGKDIPPISDCGGFYDVAPKAARAPEPNRPIAQPPVQPNTPKKSAPPMPNGRKKPRRKNHGNLLLLIGIAVLAVVCVISFVQTGALNKRMAGLERANARNLDDMDELEESIESVSSCLASVEEQLEAQESQPTEGTEPEMPLEEQALSFAVFIDSDGKDTTQASIDADIISGTGAAICRFEGELLWKVALNEQSSMPSSASAKTYVFQYDISNDILGSFAESNFTWRYRISGASEWEPIAEDEDGVSIEDSRSESTSKITLSTEWLEEHVPDGEMDLACVVERGSELGGTVTIDFGRFVGDTTDPIPEQD